MSKESDVRYGRRGGGWLPKTPPREEKPPPVARERRQCGHCGHFYVCPVDSLAACCGHSPCWELEYWSDEEWAIRAEQAAGRLALMDAGECELVAAGFEVEEISPTAYRVTRSWVPQPMTLSALDRLALRKSKQTVAA